MIENIDKLLAAMGQLIDPKRMRTLLSKVGDHAAGFIKQYPKSKRITREGVYGLTELSAVSSKGKKYTINSPFKTLKQHRWFFASLRDGKIDVPYQRGKSGGSQNLGQSWTVETIGNDSVQIGTHVTYAPLVKDADHPQSQFMAAIGWKTIQSDVRDNEGSIETAYVTALHSAFPAWND